MAQIPIKKLLLRIGLRIALIVAVGLFAGLVLPVLLRLFLPFVLAFVTASALAPVVRRLSNLPRGKVWNLWSMLLVILMILAATGIVVFAGYYLFSQLRDLLRSWEDIQSTAMGLLDALSAYLQSFAPMFSTDLEHYALNTLQAAIDWLTGQISAWAPNVVVGVSSLASGIVSFLIALLFFIVGAYFMTADYPQLRQRLSGWVPHVIRPHMRHIKAAMSSAMFGYLRAQLILSGIVSLIIFLSLLIWGQKYAIIIALICGVIDVVPFFGSGTVLVPWAVIELFMGRYGKTLFLLILALVLFLFRKLAEPKVVGNQTGLSPLLSLISIYVGMKLGGVVGMILAPVLCMIVMGLHAVGFFDPTVQDFKMLAHLILDAARLPSEGSGSSGADHENED